MLKRFSKSKYIREVNSRPKNAARYSKQLFWSSTAENDEALRESYILGTMAYMASVAFYAGKTPSDIVKELKLKRKSATLGVQEYMTDGTTLMHVNKSELKESMSWVVKINLKNALHVIDKDFMVRDESDPYVVFKSGMSMAKSQVKYNAVDASWNSTHYLFIRKRSILEEDSDKMRVYLFDSDKIRGRDGMSLEAMEKSDDLLATTEVDLELLKGDNRVKDYPITFSARRNRFAKNMSLHFSTQLLSVTEFCNEVERDGDENWLDAHTLRNPTVDWVKLFKYIKLPHVNLHPSVRFESKATSTQGWIHTLREKKVVIVAFKGTDIREWRDILTDLKMVPASLRPLANEEFILRPSKALRSDENEIHMGFRDAYASVRHTVLEALYGITGWNPEWLVVFTGHSLGGALATIAAFEAANRWFHGRKPRVAMINYGSPRVANEAFAESYIQTVPVSFRFRHCSDAIPCFPPNLYHVDHVVKGNSDGGLTVTYHKEGQSYGDRAHKENQEDQTMRQALANRPDISHHQQAAYYNKMKTAIRRVFSKRAD